MFSPAAIYGSGATGTGMITKVASYRLCSRRDNEASGAWGPFGCHGRHRIPPLSPVKNILSSTVYVSSSSLQYHACLLETFKWQATQMHKYRNHEHDTVEAGGLAWKLFCFPYEKYSTRIRCFRWSILVTIFRPFCPLSKRIWKTRQSYRAPSISVWQLVFWLKFGCCTIFLKPDIHAVV